MIQYLVPDRKALFFIQTLLIIFLSGYYQITYYMAILMGLQNLGDRGRTTTATALSAFIAVLKNIFLHPVHAYRSRDFGT